MTEDGPRAALDQLIAELRPKLHRYCARMTGSVIDGEDVLQDALVKAIEAWPRTESVANPEGWLFRIAQNAALDFLRRTRHEAARDTVDIERLAAPAGAIEARETARAGLATFLRLPAAQRSSVILKDVLGYSLGEISGMTGGSAAAVKSALQRGRTRLRALAHEPEDTRPALAASERARLARYVALFTARDFDGVRAMLADDVRLDLVGRLAVRGRGEVGEYLHHYGEARQWRFAAGTVEGRPAMLVFDANDASAAPAYFVVLEWQDDRVAFIRDFLLARYVLDGATLQILD